MTTADPQIFCDSGLTRDGNRLRFRSKGGRIVYESLGRVYPFELELAAPGFFGNRPVWAAWSAERGAPMMG